MSETVAAPPEMDRHQRLRRLAAGHGADAVIVAHLPDIRWVCGFTGSNGLLLVLHDRSIFVTDSRYSLQSEKEVRGAEIRVANGNLLEALEDVAPPRLLYQGDRITVQQAEVFDDSFPGTELRSVSGLLEELRGRKSEEEIDRIRTALAISERVLGRIAEWLVPGLTERELAAEIDYRQRLEGADGAAFDTIVAFGENAALPHARPGDRRLKPGDCVLVDTGCRVGGFASDITRNYYLGQPDPEYALAHDVVLGARGAAIEVAHAGMCARDLDAVARTRIEAAGYGPYFSHSLGHGVGLEIHEWPRVAKTSDAVLPSGAVVTIEPGIYLPDRFGLRIEDMIAIDDDGCRRLNGLPPELIIV